MTENPKDLSLELSVIPTITSDLAPVGQEFLELGIDSVLEEGVLRDIPIVGAVTGIYRAGRSIRERMFLKKVLSFLGPLSKATIEERDNFVNETLNSQKKKERFSETVVQIVERADSSEKTEIYGWIFLSHINGEIEYDNALKLCSMVDRSFIPDIRTLPRFITGETEDNLLTGELYKNGFLSLAGMDGGTFESVESGGPVYVINWYGEEIVRILGLMDAGAK